MNKMTPVGSPTTRKEKESDVANINTINRTHVRTSVDALRNTKGFAEVLEQQQRDIWGKIPPAPFTRGSMKEVKLSAHAQERLNQQNITISPQDISRINEAAQKAEIKGSRESLILLRDLALVVNIRNRTVITAISSARQKDKIFTNIDSTVIL
jgi:flagellar operon protein